MGQDERIDRMPLAHARWKSLVKEANNAKIEASGAVMVIIGH